MSPPKSIEIGYQSCYYRYCGRNAGGVWHGIRRKVKKTPVQNRAGTRIIVGAQKEAILTTGGEADVEDLSFEAKANLVKLISGPIER